MVFKIISKYIVMENKSKNLSEGLKKLKNLWRIYALKEDLKNQLKPLKILRHLFKKKTV